jgi:hypothetical protein
MLHLLHPAAPLLLFLTSADRSMTVPVRSMMFLFP